MDNSVSVHHYCFLCGQLGVSSSLLLPLHQVGKLDSCGRFGVSSSLLLPLHQVGKLDSWEDFQDRQAMTLFTTRSTAGTTEPMSSAPTANGICSLAISPAPRHGTLCALRLLLDVQPFHLLLKPAPGQSISHILQSLTVAHTWRHHRRQGTSGHV